MTILRVTEFIASPENVDDMFQFLKSLKPYITSSKGCLGIEIARNIETPEKCIVIEKWDNTKSHQESVAHFPKDKMALAMPLFKTPPTGNYYSFD